MKTGHPSDAPNYYDQAGNLRSGNRISRTLLTGFEGAPDNFRLGYSTGNDDSQWEAPRHHHNFDQVRWAMKGDYSVGRDEVLAEGHVGYFPESAFYGPQSQNPEQVLLVLQFGGPSGIGYGSVAQRRKGLEDLKARGDGTLANGIYSWIDQDGKRHNQDAFEAVWEQMYGRKITYPKPRYNRSILMDPEAYTWIVDAEQPGVSRRKMGTFSEREVRIGMVRMEAGSSLLFGIEPAVEILFQSIGSVEHDGHQHESLTAYGSWRDDPPEKLVATEASEFLYVKLPTF
jgi:hypothetical protein